MPRRREAGAVIQYALLAGPLLSMLDSSVVNVAAEPIACLLLGKSGQARSVSPVAGILLFAAPAFGPTVGGC